MEKLRAARPVNGSPSNLVGQVRKASADKFYLNLTYDDLLENGDYISTCTLTATTLSGTDVASTLLANTGGPPKNAETVTGTATGGSTTTLIDTTKNFAALGVLPGDKVVNTTKGWVATVKRIYKTTNLNDTLELTTQATAAASSDAYKFLFAGAIVQAGTSGVVYKVNWTMTSQNGRIFYDTALINVQD